ncbi:MAG: hypothetical protein K6A44_03575 [bacterium]|nr:hypothetical protein [bacterium]
MYQNKRVTIFIVTLIVIIIVMGRVMGIFLDFAPLGQDFPALRLSSNLTSLLRHSLRSAYAKSAEPTNYGFNPASTLIKKQITKRHLLFYGASDVYLLQPLAKIIIHELENMSMDEILFSA